ncbi:MAG: group III truncated hemoglobin [Pseudomonadales bacterium]
MQKTAEFVDIETREDIERFVKLFYARLLEDEQLAAIFVEVVKVDLEKHLPLISDYWEKLLLGATSYKRHTMNIHRAVHSKRELTAKDFECWLAHFHAAMDRQFRGPRANRAKHIAAQIAANMQSAMPTEA